MAYSNAICTDTAENSKKGWNVMFGNIQYCTVAFSIAPLLLIVLTYTFVNNTIDYLYFAELNVMMDYALLATAIKHDVLLF